MRLILMFGAAVGLIWATLHPREVLLALEDAGELATRMEEAIRFTEPDREEVRRRSAYEAWLANPSYDVRSLEKLWTDTGEYTVLLHLAEAVAQGCGPAYESRVLDANHRRFRPSDFVEYRRLQVVKGSRCAGRVPASP